MSDDLTVSQGGSISVADDELFAEAARLGAISARVADWAERAGRIRRGLEADGLDRAASARGGGFHGEPVALLRTAELHLAEVEELCADLKWSLEQAAEVYGFNEKLIAGWFDLGTHLVFAGLGAAAVPVAVAAGVVGLSTHGWNISKLVSDPSFVKFVRAAGGSLDEAVLTSLGASPTLSLLLGSQIGAPENAAVLFTLAAAAGGFGGRVLAESRVSVRRADAPPAAPGALMGTRSATAPVPAPVRVAPAAGIGELARRVPSPADGEPQIRIERYGECGDQRFIVYVSGTIEWGFGTDQPFDGTNAGYGVANDSGGDLEALAGYPSGAASRAVREALVAAGWVPGDPVLPIGHSAGGSIVAEILADPEMNADFGVNLGGPIASADIGDAKLLSIEHEEDLVPATGGPGNSSPGVTTVSRSVLDQDTDYSQAVPAHQLPLYRDTAALIDASDDPALQDYERIVREFTGGEQGERTDWIATRELSEPAVDRPFIAPDLTGRPELPSFQSAPVSPSQAAR